MVLLTESLTLHHNIPRYMICSIFGSLSVDSEEVGRKLGSRVDRSISNGNFAESVIYLYFCLVSRKISLTPQC